MILWSFYYGIVFEALGVAILLADSPIENIKVVGMVSFLLGFIMVGTEYKRLESSQKTEVKK